MLKQAKVHHKLPFGKERATPLPVCAFLFAPAATEKQINSIEKYTRIRSDASTGYNSFQRQIVNLLKKN